MTPAARISAAIEILDRVLAGAPAERELTNWGRANRFAGSKDRAAIRDHVFDALRCLGSFAALGGARTGRGVMLGALGASGADPSALFTGERFAPAALSADETAALTAPAPDDLAQLDWPAWMLPRLSAGLGDDFGPVSEVMRQRAPVTLRVNIARATAPEAMESLASEGVQTAPHKTVETALIVTEGARRVQTSQAYLTGLVEVQDASSQAAVGLIPVPTRARGLDYCAGGGGKALALAARFPDSRIFTHDIDAGRMRDIPVRAERAGVNLTVLPPGKPGKSYDVVMVDAPCSGSGTWRRTPEAKWRLTPKRLDELMKIQSQVIESASKLVIPDGRLVYMTCSVFADENQDRLAGLLQSDEWSLEGARHWLPDLQGDGFYLAILRKQA